MADGRISKLRIGYKGKEVTLTEGAKILNIGVATIRFHIKNGRTSVEEITPHMKGGSKSKMGGTRGIKRKTSRGEFYIGEIVEAHEHGLQKRQINYRGDVWGWDHKALWLPSLPSKEFCKTAREIDGEPRGRNAHKIKSRNTSPSLTLCEAEDNKFNRNKVCYERNSSGNIIGRCRHYYNLTESFYPGVKTPAMCEEADSECVNFEPIPLVFENICESKPVRYYEPSGAVGVFR